jgi:hypothetical protein
MSAGAELTHPYTGVSFGPEGLGAGSFSQVQSVAVDQSNGDVYIYDTGFDMGAGAAGGAVYKFNAAGEPLPFGEGTGNVLENVGAKGFKEVELAVDNSAGVGQGDLYVATGSLVKVYSPAGKLLSELNGGEGVPWGTPCGVAVDPVGNVYVGLYPSTVNKYLPSGSSEDPVSNSDYVSSLWGVQAVCNVAADAEENVYTDGWQLGPEGGPVVKYAKSQLNTKEEAANGTVIDNVGNALAIDPAGNQLYIDEDADQIGYEFSGGTALSTFGSGIFASSYGVAINGTSGTPASGDVYVGDGEHASIDIFGPLAEVANVSGEAPANVDATSATLSGSVNPEGISPVSPCVFDYEYAAAGGRHAASVSCDSASPLEGTSSIAVQASLSGLRPATLYHYSLRATNVNATNAISGTFTTLATSPTLEGAPASAGSTTRTTALLSGSLNPGGDDTLYHFAYVNEAGYREALSEGAGLYSRGGSTPALDGGSGGEEEAVGPIKLIGLLPATTYHYALVATNALGTVVGPDHTFTTGAATPPVALTGATNVLGPTSATLSGSLDTEGLTSSYGFELGSEAGSYNASIVVGTVGGAVTLPVSLRLQTLQPDTTYHYRLTASNVDGTSYGADATFTTPGYPEALVAPTSLPLLAAPSTPFPTAVKVKTVVKKAVKKSKVKHKAKHKTKDRKTRRVSAVSPK